MSSWIRVNLLFFISSINFFCRNSIKRSSFSIAITLFDFSKSFLVRLPFPGPISKIISFFSILAAEIILSRILDDFKKFWPNDFLAFISKMNTGVEKSDAIRYYVVEKYGGVYVDADVTPNRSLNPILSLDKEVIICHDLEVTWEYISIGFFASVPNHPLFKELNKRIFSAKINTGESHMHTGPRLFGQCIFDVKPEQNYGIIPTKYFYKNVVDSTDIEELNGSETFSGRFGNHLYKKN